jgi:hypothetical protein
MTTLAKLLARLHGTTSTTSALPARALVLDSCPGSARLRSSIRAFTAPLKNPIAKALFGVFIFFFLTTWRLVHAIGGQRNPFDVLWSDMTDARYFPNESRRLYIYSTADKVLLAEGVERHLVLARKRLGEEMVRTEKYVDTPHVNHLSGSGGPERYWGGIWKLWLDAMN